MKAPCSRHCIALVIAAAATLGAPQPAVGRAPAAQDDAAALAKAAVRRARKATQDQDFAAAIEHFREALRHQPSPTLHFNIGVCHHRLMGTHPARSPAFEEHRGAAVDAYNRYLKTAPNASDTQEVTDMIRALGGTPLSADQPEPWTIELVEPDAVPDAPSFDEDDGPPSGEPPSDEPPPDVPPPEPVPLTTRDHPSALTHPRWGLGVYLPLILASPAGLAANGELRPAPALGLGLRGHGFLGSNRGLQLGGEMALTTQTLSSQKRHRLSVAYLGAVLEYHRRMGKGRWELGGGGLIGVGSEALVFDGEPRMRCANDREASRRNGMWAGARVYLATLLGKRRNHALTFRLGPGLGLFTAGSLADVDANDLTCEGEPTAFDRFGLDEGASLIITFDVGYSPRF